MSDTVPAWLIDPGTPFALALGRHEIIEVIEEITPWALPVGPACCDRVIAWRDRLLPLANLALLDSDTRSDAHSSRAQAVIVVAYQRGPEEPVEYGAIELRAMPTAIKVSDDEEAPLPRLLSSRWRNLTIACFLHGPTAVLVPDLARLFAP